MSATSIVSGRVDSLVKSRVEAKVRSWGRTPSDIVSELYDYIDLHGSLPWHEETETSSDDAWLEYLSIINSTPQCEALAKMTDAEIKEVLANRA